MSRPDDIVQVKRLDSPAALRARLAELGADLPVDDVVDPAGPLAQRLVVRLPDGDRTLANRFTILPMEGWDGTDDGRPTDLVRRRWRRFGHSGASLVWGGEAVAVTADGRANPHQLWFGPETEGDLASLRAEVVAGHREAVEALEAEGLDPAAVGAGDGVGGPLVGLQLTHSGRWARPEGLPAPRTAYRHPVLDDRVGAGVGAVLTDDELDDLVAAFVRAAEVAAAAGFDFVDVKQCHGYLGHELLSAVDRPGPYGGDLDGRTRFVRSVLDGIRSAAPALGLGVRLSLFDIAPHSAGPDGVGVAQLAASADGGYAGSYPYAFGGDGTGVGIDLTEVHALVDRLVAGGVSMLCATASSPYYAPHAQRPAFFPPSDGYLPPRDPLVDVAVLQGVTAQLARAHPEVVVVGSGLTYLQDWFAHVAQPLVAGGSFHSAGLGRMVLSYPTLPIDVLTGSALDRRAVCRTFSDCTTAPRHGLVSGCYPLDPFYKGRPERVELTKAKRAAEAARGGRRRSAR